MEVRFARLVLTVTAFATIAFTQVAPAQTIVWSQLPDYDPPYAPGSVVTTQRCADDIQFDAEQSITGLNWWGGTYNGDLVDTFRVRFYEDASGLPGTVLFEEDVMPTSALTGEILPGDPGPDEYLFSADLLQTFVAEASTTYWVEVAGYYVEGEHGAFGWSSSNSALGDGNDVGVFWSHSQETWNTGLPDRALQLTIPEPGSLALLIFAAPTLLRRRR